MDEFDIGYYYLSRFRQSVRERGVYQTARNLRKQGVPLHVALAMLHKLH